MQRLMERVVKKLAFLWGIGGVIALLSFAVVRLSRYALEMELASLTPLHWLALLFSICFMAYSEGYRGFYLQFSPRVVRRASFLGSRSRPHELLLAPLFCMGYFHATRPRLIATYALTLMIISFVILVPMLPQPWRGIIDVGVVVGLAMGILSICYFVIMEWRGDSSNGISPGFPDDSSLLSS